MIFSVILTIPLESSRSSIGLTTLNPLDPILTDLFSTSLLCSQRSRSKFSLLICIFSVKCSIFYYSLALLAASLSCCKFL